MFTGIVEGIRPITTINDNGGSKRLHIDLHDFLESVAIGDSVAVDGVCLTVVEIADRIVSFDVIQETLIKTTLGNLHPDSKVNIERSLRAHDRIHGHFVQGHVFGIGKIVERIATKGEFKLWIKADELMKYVAPVGSIAVQGVSLTVSDVREDMFAVALIPTTLELTNLGNLLEGDGVNLEPDMIARQIVHFLERQSAK